MTPEQVIEDVRELVQDTRVPYRYSDTTLLQFVNNTLKRIAMLRPDLFSYLDTAIPVTVGSVVQTLPADSTRLVEIFQVVDSSGELPVRTSVTEVNRETLDMTTPSWVAETASVPTNFMRHIRNSNKYFLYPPPKSGITLVGEYIQSPPNYTLLQDIELLPSSYLPSVVDGVVYLAESLDNEHVNSGRAKMFLDLFTESLGVTIQSRVITDTESAGMNIPTNPKQVI
jgi:hypothetical protein